MSKKTTTRTMAAGLVVGVVATAALVGATVVLADGGADADLPDTLGDKVAIDTDAAFPADVDQKAKDEAADNYETAVTYNNEQMGKLYGVDVATAQYVPLEQGEGSQFIATVIDKEVDLAPPVAFNAPELGDLAAPSDEVVEEDDVACLVGRNQVPKAQSSDEALAPLTITCQKSADGITARVFASNAPDLDETVEATEELFDAVS